jgi:hypothetical protein
MSLNITISDIMLSNFLFTIPNLIAQHIAHPIDSSLGI